MWVIFFRGRAEISEQLPSQLNVPSFESSELLSSLFSLFGSQSVGENLFKIGTVPFPPDSNDPGISTGLLFSTIYVEHGNTVVAMQFRS